MSFLNIDNVTRPRDGFVMECVDKHDSVAVVLFNSDYSKVLLVSQFRAGVKNEILELPAGIIEENEDAISAMYRELREETGYERDDIIDEVDLGTYYVSPGYTSEKIHLFRARINHNAIANDLQLDSNEDITTHWVDILNVINISSDMKTQMGITKALDIPKKRIGIYCGSFNPITHLHLLTLERAIEELILDIVIIEPERDQYCKKELIPVGHRMKMLQLGIENNSKLQVGTFKMDQTVQPNTINTLQYYKDKYGWCEIYFICDSDNLKDMIDRPWPNYEKILDEFNIICVRRDNDNVYQDIILHDKYMVKFKNNIHVINENVINNISSSAIRNLVRAKMSIKYLVPASVEKYIYENNLYLKE